MTFYRGKQIVADHLVLLLAVLFAFPLYAQQYNFQHYTVANGLPQSQVNCIYQDHDGYIWIGTEGGVSRFDGVIFQQYIGGENIPGSEVMAITESDEGHLFATDSGIVVFSGDQFQLYLYPWRHNTVKVNLFFKGLFGETLLATSRGLYNFNKGQYTLIRTSTPIDQLSIRAAYVDKQNHLWLGTERNGLFQFSAGAGKYVNMTFNAQEDLSETNIRGLVELDSGKLWIATAGNGLLVYDGKKIDQVALPDKIKTLYFSSAHKDQSNGIWFGTWGKGVIHYANSQFQMLNKENGLGDDIVISIQSDQQGNMWFATYSSGLVFFYGQQFFSFTQKDGLPDNNIRALELDQKGNMWIATLEGIAVYNGADFKVWNQKNGLSYNRIGALAADDKGRIYAGTLSGEINVFESTNSPPRIYEIGTRVNPHPGEILSLLYSRKGVLWVGTAISGLFKLENGQLEPVNTGNVLQGNPIWSIYQDDQDQIWLGTEHGLYTLINGNAVRPKVSGLKDPTVLDYAIYDVTGDQTYIYTAIHRNGIGLYNKKTAIYSYLNKNVGLGSNFARGILQMDKQTMYVTTVLGLDLIHFKDTGKLVQHYWYSDGIGTSNFTPGVLKVDRNGRIWLGSTDGVVIYSPQLKRIHSATPRIQLKEILLFNQKVDWKVYTDSLSRNGLPYRPVLTYDMNNITFVLAGIQFGTGVNIGYEYQLQGGTDTTWIRQSSGNTVTFQNLSPGDYTFRVKAFNSNGFFSDQYVFHFTIQAPFWATGWFFLIVLASLVGIIAILLFAYRRYREEFLKDQRSLYNHQQSTARLFLISSGIVYPVAGLIIKQFEKDVDFQTFIQISLGLLSLGLGLATYISPYIKRQAYQLSHFTIALILMHLMLLNYINNLSSVTVTSLIIALAAISIIYDNLRSLISISTLLVLSALVLIFLHSNHTTDYNPWLFLLSIVISLIVAYVSVISRLNLINRLLFADTTLNNSRSLILACNKEGEIIFVSSSATAILGYESHELMGDGWWNIRSNNEDENKRIRDTIVNSKNLSATYMAPVRTKNGAIRWIQWVDTEMDDGIKVGIGLDVTERHEIEERYRHIVEAATDIIYTADQDGRFTYVNDVAVKIMGYPIDELIGRQYTELIHPDWVDEVRSFYEKQFQRQLLVTNLEFPVVRSDGGIVWIGQTVRLIFDEIDTKRIRGFQSIARDITEKKQYEEELEKLSLVASETINGVLICDPDSDIEWVNEGFTRITGYSLAEVRGQRSGDILNGEKTDMSVIYAARQKTLAGQGFEVELLVYHKNGSELWISVSNTPIVDENGRLLKQIEIFTDISEKKRYELQLSHYSKRLELLNAAKQVLVFSDSIDIVASNVLKIFTEQISFCDRMSLSLFDEQQGTVEMMTLLRNTSQHEELIKRTIPLSSLRSLSFLRRNQHFLVDNLKEVQTPSEFEKFLLEEGIFSYLIMPLFTEDGLIGAVSISTREIDQIEAEDIDLLRELADVMAATIQKLRYRDIIQQKNTDISASINYARRIQDAILPPDQHLKDVLGDMFVLYRPKDVLSGDYYWVETRDEYTFIAVADSTGHGVPGALLSLMGHNLLNQAIQERKLISPAAILDYLNIGVQQTLNQYKKEGELRDGMDIALCVFERNSKKLMFAGAINPLYIVRNGELIQLKSNRFSIGSYFDQKRRPFDLQEMELQSGDILYMFTDGFADQFGGEGDRKMSYRRFRELILRLQHLPLEQQREILNNQLDSWMRGGVQTDDVCVLGIKIS